MEERNMKESCCSTSSSLEPELSVVTSTLVKDTEESSVDTFLASSPTEEGKMVIKEGYKTPVSPTTNLKDGSGVVIAALPPSILSETKIKLKDSSDFDKDEEDFSSRLTHHQSQNKNLKNITIEKGEDHLLNEDVGSNSSCALDIHNQLNILERILFPENHHKVITPRITITIDPSMVFDECEEEEADSDDEEENEGNGSGVHEEELADIEEDDDSSSSVFLELASDTGMSDKTIAELDTAGTDLLIEELDGSSSGKVGGGGGGGPTSSSTITIDDSGIIITCEKYGKVPLFFGDDDQQHPPSQSISDIDSDNVSSVGNNSNANHDHQNGKEGLDSNSATVTTSLGVVSSEDESNSQQQQLQDCIQSDVNVASRSHKLGRASSSPSNTNLSEPSSEPGESLKIEEVKPRRRNTIADIFRW